MRLHAAAVRQRLLVSGTRAPAESRQAADSTTGWSLNVGTRGGHTACMSAIFRQASSAFAGVGASGSALLREAAPQAVVRSARASKPLARFTSRSIRPPRPLPRVGLQEEGCPLAVAGSSERLAMMPGPDGRSSPDDHSRSWLPDTACSAARRRAHVDSRRRRAPRGGAGRAIPGVRADARSVAEHCEVLRAGAGAVVAVPDHLRASVGCGEGRGSRPVPRLAAQGRLAGVGIDRAQASAVQRGHDRAAPAGGVLVLPLPAFQRRRGRVAPLRARVLRPAPVQADARAPRPQARP